MTNIDRADRGPRSADSRPPRFRLVATLALALALAPAVGSANPVPDREAQEMNDLPGRWLGHPNPEDAQGLIAQFGAYGISRGLLSNATVNLLEQNFDRFAPLLVTAQLPPYCTQPSLQRWYREHADETQGAAMKAALRIWLDAKVTEAPIQGGMRIQGSPEDLAPVILNARLAAAEALGDWCDKSALPKLRALQRQIPGGSPILTAAIRRITDPSRADVLVLEHDGRVAMHRPASELDSLVVVSQDGITRKKSRWRADGAGVAHIWSALDEGREYDRHQPYVEPEDRSFLPGQLTMYFRDGLIANLEGSRNRWNYEDNGRQNSSLEIRNDALDPALMHELERIGIAPAMPRFVAESVTLEIDPGELRVTGLYEFEGAPRDGWLPLRYPIATAEGLGSPRIDAIKLSSARDHKALPVTFEQHGTECRIALTPGQAHSYELEVHYRQALTGRTAKYLITTAREWGRPLHRGWFQVIMDASLGEPHFGLGFREVGERPGFRRFLYEAAPFQPEQDLVVDW
jgi:hypothetical protein